MCERCDPSCGHMYKEVESPLTPEEENEFAELMEKFHAWRPFGVPAEADGLIRWGSHEKLAVARLWDKLEGLDKAAIGALMSAEMGMENVLLNSGLVIDAPSDLAKRRSIN